MRRPVFLFLACVSIQIGSYWSFGVGGGSFPHPEGGLSTCSLGVGRKFLLGLIRSPLAVLGAFCRAFEKVGVRQESLRDIKWD